MATMDEAKPEAIDYLRRHHVRIWTRSQFSTMSKVDYVTNNLAESFNNSIKEYKALHLYHFMDNIIWKLMLFEKR